MKDEKKVLEGIFLDFLIDFSRKFKGRLDEGDISLEEINDFIENWIKKNF